MGTKLKPGAHDCYENAEPDEPYFVFLARDATAPFFVRGWAKMRERLIDEGHKPDSDRAMVDEALQCAEAMEAWRKEHR